MKPSECPAEGCGQVASEKPGKRQALCAARKARRTAERLEQAFRLLAEEDPIHPTIEYVYAALCEAESRASVMEDRTKGTAQAMDC